MLADGSTRTERIEREELIDVAEWAEPLGLPLTLPFPTALTRALWDAVASLPFREAHASSMGERIRRVLHAAERALIRATEPPLGLDPEAGFLATFGVALQCRSTEPRWRPLHLLCDRDESGEIVLTIGLVEEGKPVPRHWSE
jgi:hypothetical protein